jgi:DNA polymerase I
MIALIDADSLIYKAGFTFEDKFCWNELELELGIDEIKEEQVTYDVLLAKNAIDACIENIKFNTGCDEVELWLTSGSNFRYEVYEDYKSNRKSGSKPMAYDSLFKYLIDRYKANIAYGVEADDIVVYKKTNYPDDYYLCAIDKDVLLQTEGSHLNYNNNKTIKVTTKEAERFFYFQVLMGDVTDGYPGCKGIGKVKANKILDECEKEGLDYWETIVTTYESKGLTEEFALSQARCASMHQVSIDKEGKFKIDLWSPESHK